MDFVSWDDDIPFPTFHGKSFKIPWFQTTYQLWLTNALKDPLETPWDICLTHEMGMQPAGEFRRPFAGIFPLSADTLW